MPKQIFKKKVSGNFEIFSGKILNNAKNLNCFKKQKGLKIFIKMSSLSHCVRSKKITEKI